jgi:hypothetical protein
MQTDQHVCDDAFAIQAIGLHHFASLRIPSARAWFGFSGSARTSGRQLGFYPSINGMRLETSANIHSGRATSLFKGIGVASPFPPSSPALLQYCPSLFPTKQMARPSAMVKG